MNFIISLLAFIFVMGIIVTIHELGHLLAAKKFGVYCGEFAIGMGPKIAAFKGKETVYTLRLLPIGGFVSMAGEEDNQENLPDLPIERTLNGIKTYQKVIVLLAGIAMNVLLAFVINIGIYMYQGRAISDGPIQVVQVENNSNAAKNGFQAGDKITELQLADGKKVTVQNYNATLTYLVADRVEKVIVERNEKNVTLDYVQTNEKNQTAIDGIQLQPNVVKLQWYESFGYAAKKIGNDSTVIFRTLGNLVRGIGADKVSGPIGIFNAVGQVAQNGIVPLFALLSLISLNIGLFNLLPVPALDGGRVVLVVLEKILKDRYSKKIETYLIVGSFILLLGLIALVTFNDIIKMF